MLFIPKTHQSQSYLNMLFSQLERNFGKILYCQAAVLLLKASR